MNDKSYSQTIRTKASPDIIFDKIENVSEWWAKDFEGKSNKVGDIFTIRFEKGDTFTIKVVEIDTNKKIVWEVISANQAWVKEPTEWVGTNIVWDIITGNNVSEIHFTHIGLVPELECYGTCQVAWNYLMQKSLAELLNTGKGLPA
jgi:hypothetical protein